MLFYNLPKASIQEKLMSCDAGAITAIRKNFLVAVNASLSTPRSSFEHMADVAIKELKGSLRDYFNPSTCFRFAYTRKPDETDLWEFAGWHVRNTPGVNGDTLRKAINDYMGEKKLTAADLGLTPRESRSLVIHPPMEIPFNPAP